MYIDSFMHFIVTSAVNCIHDVFLDHKIWKLYFWLKELLNNSAKTESDCDIQLFWLALSEIYDIDMLFVFWFAMKLQDTFVSCIADLFENQVVQFDGILKSGCYAKEVRWTMIF